MGRRQFSFFSLCLPSPAASGDGGELGWGRGVDTHWGISVPATDSLRGSSPAAALLAFFIYELLQLGSQRGLETESRPPA